MTVENNLLLILMPIIIFLISIIIIFTLTLYLLTAISLYLLAKDRNIKNPWLGFVPYCGSILIGELAEDVYIGNKKIPFPGLWLLLGQFISLPLNISKISFAITKALEKEKSFFIFSSMTRAFFSIFEIIFSLALIVYTGFVVYNLFQKYDSKNALLFTILSCVFPIIFPILLLCVRKKYGNGIIK